MYSFQNRGIGWGNRRMKLMAISDQHQIPVTSGHLQKSHEATVSPTQSIRLFGYFLGSKIRFMKHHETMA